MMTDADEELAITMADEEGHSKSLGRSPSHHPEKALDEPPPLRQNGCKGAGGHVLPSSPADARKKGAAADEMAGMAYRLKSVPATTAAELLAVDAMQTLAECASVQTPSAAAPSLLPPGMMPHVPIIACCGSHPSMVAYSAQAPHGLKPLGGNPLHATFALPRMTASRPDHAGPGRSQAMPSASPAHLNGSGGKSRAVIRVVPGGRDALRQNSHAALPGVSRFRGVSFKRSRKSKPWKACITVNNVTRFLGYFETEREAACAYDRVAGEHQRPTNFPYPPAGSGAALASDLDVPGPSRSVPVGAPASAC